MKKILPFYMTYPLPIAFQEEDRITKDLEYLQQMYPAEAKKYQKRIAEIIDKMDYEGSMIYDEYPDKWHLLRLTNTVVELLKNEEEQALGLQNRIHPEEKDEEPGIQEERWKCIAEMVQILIFYEIFKRRQQKHQGYLQF